MTGALALPLHPGACLQKLFAGAPVVTDQRRLTGDPTSPAPHPEEAAQIANAVPGRRIEYLSGRGCARRALRQLGVQNFALLNGPDRAPRWPPGIVGALTHTGPVPGGYCAVVVARATDLLTVGLDAEEAGPLPRDLWRLVLTDGERSTLEEADRSDQEPLAKIIFSAKECFYKAQYALTGRLLQFRDVEIQLHRQASTFRARPKDAAGLPPQLITCTGQYLVENGLILTGMAAPARH